MWAAQVHTVCAYQYANREFCGACMVQVVDASSLQEVQDATKQPTLIAVAAYFGSVRLIDNLEIK